jgi:hypothetical protein
MQNAIKLENMSNLITSPSSYQCRKSMTWGLVDFVMLCISIIVPTRIEIIHGRDSLYNKGKIIFV